MITGDLICDKCRKESPENWICQCSMSMVAPRWMARPNGPGLWLCDAGDSAGTLPRIAAVELSADDIENGAPFRTVAVFGPIPSLG